MTDEAQVVDEQAEREAFEAGFNAVRGEPEVEKKPEPEKADEPVDPEALKAVAEEVEAEEPALTKEQVSALLAKVQEYDSIRQSHDKLAGRVGSLMQEIEALKKPPEKPKVELPPVDESEFAQSYPEFASYLQAQLGKVKPADDIMQRLAQAEERNQQLAQTLEERTISLAMPDWAETVNSDGYKAWLLTQPNEVQQVAASTTYANDLMKILGAYKQTATKAQVAAKNKARLEAAVVPAGIPAQKIPEPSEEDAFRAGWEAVRGRLL